MSETMTLVEQGVDSLVAVEIRSWFLKELDIDMPVLKVLGGASIADLLEDAFNRLPANLVPKIPSINEPLTAVAIEESKGRGQKNEDPVLQSTEEASLSASKTSKSEMFSQDGTPSSGSTSTPTSEPQEDEDTASETSMISIALNSTVKGPVPTYATEITARMSFGQSRFWFLNHFLRDETTFNMAFSVRLEGDLSVADLGKALTAVGEKHEALRTRFFSVGDHMEQPMQGILGESLLQLKQKHINHEDQATQELDEMRAHKWNLEHWETMRVTLLSLSKTTHILIVGCHHIAMDGLSFQIFFADLEKAYMGRKLIPCPAESQYRAFSAIQHQDYEQGNMEADLEFYRRIIQGDPQPLPLFPFARKSSRMILDSYDTHRADFRLDPSLTAQIKDRSRRQKATTFHFYLATLQSLVFRLLDIDDFFIGIADANRTDSRFMGTLGFFLNLLPLRFQRGTAKTFTNAIHEARNKVYSALAHSKLPFDVLLNQLKIGRSATHTPLFQIFVDYRQGVQERTTFAGCEAKGESWHIAKTGYDVALDIIENAAGDSLLTLRLQKSLYSSDDTKMLLQSFVNLLTAFSVNSDIPVAVPSLWQRVEIERAIKLGQG